MPMEASRSSSRVVRLSPALLVAAYSQGVFPMAMEDGEVYWFDPDPRAVLPLDRFHVSHSLRRRLKRGDYEIRVDTAFEMVIEACAAPSLGRDKTWISAEFIEAYTALHRWGYAHSVESWQGGELVGGLYGVAIRGLFAGESMFSRRPDASKVALFHLVRRLRMGGFLLLDVQFLTDHLKQFGAEEISSAQYKRRLATALQATADFVATH